MDDKKRKALYDAVSQDYDLGSFDDFNKKMDDSKSRKAFYDGVGKEYELGSYSDFETKIGGEKKYGQSNWFSKFWQWLKDFPI